MKNLLVFIILGVVANPALAQKVTVDSDPDADFSQYSSYELRPGQEDIDTLLNSLDQDRLKDAFKAEFDSRNLEQKESEADMVVSIYVVLDQMTSTRAYTDYYGGTRFGYGRRGRGWGNGYSTTRFVESDYIQGTLVLDVFDSESNELIWQAVATGAMKENPKKRDKAIPKTVKKLMKDFPIKPSQ